jgi:hypothetical protein
MRVYNLHGRRDNKYKARIKILVHEVKKTDPPLPQFLAHNRHPHRHPDYAIRYPLYEADRWHPRRCVRPIRWTLLRDLAERNSPRMKSVFPTSRT